MIIGYALEAVDIVRLGLPLVVYQAAGAALFMASMLVILHHSEKRLQQSIDGLSARANDGKDQKIVHLFSTGDDDKERKERLINDARSNIAAATKYNARDSLRTELESCSAFLGLRPYLSKNFLDKLYSGEQATVANPSGKALSGLTLEFLDELERLEKEWGLL